MNEQQSARLPLTHGKPQIKGPSDGKQASPSNPSNASEYRLTETFTLRCTAKEREIIKARAKADQTTASELLRAALGLIKPSRRRAIPKADPRLVVALNAIGSNLNQIARAMNAARLAGDMRQLEALHLVSALVSIDRELNALLASHSKAEASDAD